MSLKEVRSRTTTVTKQTSKRSEVSVRFTEVDVVDALRRHLEEGDSNLYRILVRNVSVKETEVSVLRSWLTVLRQHCTWLDQRCDTLVSALLKLNWTTYDEMTVREYSTFLLNLVSAHTYYLNSVLTMLIRNFLPPVLVDMKGETPGNKDARSSYSLTVLKGIIRIVPMSSSVLITLLPKYFPFILHTADLQEAYVRNLIRLIEYLPDRRREILEIIIERIMKLDTYCPKQEITVAEENRDSEGVVDDETVFEMDVDGITVKATKGSMAHPLADLLDRLMELMLKYIHSLCFEPGSDELNWESTKAMFLELWTIFDKLILPTHSCCHVQFLMFYFCSFKPALADTFVEFLWKKVQDPNTPCVLRQAAISYVGSFLARAKYAEIRLVLSTLKLVCAWIHRYITSQTDSDRSHADVNLHAPFYSVCQNVFYVFVFRHQELLGLSEGFTYLSGLNFERMVTCRLNPLKMCLPAVTEKFAAIARNYQLAYCYTVIEKNQRATLPTSAYNRNGDIQPVNCNLLDSFFPFDPYILTRSSYLISPLYKEYQGVVEESRAEAEIEEDEFLEDFDPPTPGADDSVLGTSLMDFLKIDMSPGFKQ